MTEDELKSAKTMLENYPIGRVVPKMGVQEVWLDRWFVEFIMDALKEKK